MTVTGVTVFVTGLAAAAFILFIVGVLRDRRSFGNAILLGLTLALGALAAVAHLAEDPDRKARLLLDLLLLVTAVGPFLVGGFLVVNGITLIRRERFRPVNLLSLATGIGIFAVIGLTLAAARAGSLQLTLLTGVADLLFGYVSFQLVSFVIYALLYGSLAALWGPVEFVVVLGAGLKRDGRPTPLLAKRLNRGIAVYQSLAALAARDAANRPMIVVSGGRGDDERLAEARSMALYLTDRGVSPADILLEEHSRNTEENLLFSQDLMDRVRPDVRCVIVTSNFHVFRTAMLARRLGIRGDVTGAPVAWYYWPSAMLREFAAVFLSYRVVNFAICALIVLLPLAYVALRSIV